MNHSDTQGHAMQLITAQESKAATEPLSYEQVYKVTEELMRSLTNAYDGFSSSELMAPGKHMLRAVFTHWLLLTADMHPSGKWDDRRRLLSLLHRLYPEYTDEN